MDSNAVTKLLSETKVKVSSGTFTLASLSHQDWRRLLQNPRLGPDAESQFMIFLDEREVTLLVGSEDWRQMSHIVPEAKCESDFRLITLDAILGWEVVGYLARVTEILAAADISVGALSSFSRDHLLIKQKDLAKALLALGGHTAESC